MDKKKPIIIGLTGFGALALGAYKLVKTIYSGSKFLDSYIDKCNNNFVKINSKIRLEDDGYYSITKEDDKPFRVLQLTDLHIGGGYFSRHEDMRALAIVKNLINKTKPDLIVLTGDLTCSKAHISLSRNNLHSYEIITNLLESTGIPYAVTFGNHDVEGRATHQRRELGQFLMTKQNSLLVRTDETETITGFSNYVVKLRNKSGKLNSLLFMLDSNEYIYTGKKKEYDYIHDDQLQWYENVTNRINKEEGRIVPSHIFMHIPVKEYEEAWDAAINAKKGAVYYYGTKDEAISTQNEKCRLFEKVKELGSTKAIYCGHDHLNDFSVEYEGIRFTYGQGIDCLLYAKTLSEHKGGTLITIHKNGTFEIKGKKHR